MEWYLYVVHIPFRNNGLLLVKNSHYFYKGDVGFYDLNCTCSKNVKLMDRVKGFLPRECKKMHTSGVSLNKGAMLSSRSRFHTQRCIEGISRIK